MSENKIGKLPILYSDNKIKGLITFKNLVDYNKNSHKYSLNENDQLFVGAAIGITDDWHERAVSLIDVGCDIICIDVAHGHTQTVFDVTNSLRTEFPDIDIMVGNVCTSRAFEFLCKAGASCIRVSIGTGSICTTRSETGIGKPQLSSLMECQPMAKKYGVGMISDGGLCGNDGNIIKAMVFSQAIMVGNHISATDETPGVVRYRNNKRTKHFRGMASAYARLSKNEKQNKEDDKSIASEGVDTEVELKGSINDILDRMSQNLRSSMSYLGCAIINQIHQLNENGEIVFRHLSSER